MFRIRRVTHYFAMLVELSIMAYIHVHVYVACVLCEVTKVVLPNYNIVVKMKA